MNSLINYKTLIRYSMFVLTGYWLREQYISLDMQAPIVDLLTEFAITVVPAIVAYLWNLYDEWKKKAKALLLVESKNLTPSTEAVVKSVINEIKV